MPRTLANLISTLLMALLLSVWLLRECAPPTQAALRSVQLLRVQPLGSQVQVSVLIISDTPLEVSTQAATRVQVFPTSDSTGTRRTTITATLDACDGRITVRDGAERWDWRPYCQWLPTIGARP